MASDVDICNLALANLGDTANVTSINPPDGSAQAALCWRFYPVARDALLELHSWGFSTTRIALALLSVNPTKAWAYCYAAPANVLNYIEVLDPEAVDEYTVGVQFANTIANSLNSGIGNYVPQAFEVGTNADGTDIILTNQENAVCRYTRLVDDPTKFSPLFIEALGWSLAAKLAGPLIKGSEGRKAAQDCMRMTQAVLERATESDANQRRIKLTHGAPWMVNR